MNKLSESAGEQYTRSECMVRVSGMAVGWLVAIAQAFSNHRASIVRREGGRLVRMVRVRKLNSVP